MRSKNISVIPVTKETIKSLSGSLFLAPKSRLFRPVLDILIIDYVQRVRLSHGTERSDTDCNFLAVGSV